MGAGDTNINLRVELGPISEITVYLYMPIRRENEYIPWCGIHVHGRVHTQCVCVFVGGCYKLMQRSFSSLFFTLIFEARLSLSLVFTDLDRLGGGRGDPGIQPLPRPEHGSYRCALSPVTGGSQA